MSRYYILGIAYATTTVDVATKPTENEAWTMARSASLCNQCSDQVEISDIEELQLIDTKTGDKTPFKKGKKE